MVVTLGIVRASVNKDDDPRFDRITGLMTLAAVTFLIILAIEKTRIRLFFAGSIPRLMGLLIGVFALLKWAAYMLFRRRGKPKLEPPAFPLISTDRVRYRI